LRVRLASTTALLIAVLLALAGCADGGGEPDPNVDPQQVDAVEQPRAGACRKLAPADLNEPTNAAKVVSCADEHTAQTIHVGEFGSEFADAAWDAEVLGAQAYAVCGKKFNKHVGADESLALRTTLTWAWFRPSEKAWADGARWFRCDVVGGGADSEQLQPLPEDTRRLLLGRPDDKWLVCADGPTVTDSKKVSCTEPHRWRAVTTVVLEKPEAAYPGDRVVEVRTRDFCRSSVGAWLNYPKDYDFGYTWFHEAEWAAGNRRSICWAWTED
jgi:Septum formation